jgi:hypothetical protein
LRPVALRAYRCFPNPIPADGYGENSPAFHSGILLAADTDNNGFANAEFDPDEKFRRRHVARGQLAIPVFYPVLSPLSANEDQPHVP